MLKQYVVLAHGPQRRNFTMEKLMTIEQALPGCLLASPVDMPTFPSRHLMLKTNTVSDKPIFFSLSDTSSTLSSGQIGAGNSHRSFFPADQRDPVTLEFVTEPPAMVSITFRLDIVAQQSNKRAAERDRMFDHRELEEAYRNHFAEVAHTSQEMKVFHFQGNLLKLNIDAVNVKGDQDGVSGVLVATPRAGMATATRLVFISDNPKIILTNAPQREAFDSKVSMTGYNLGIGGLDDILDTIRRHALTTRMLPTSVIKKFGIQHSRGIILHGPPGTGKTLIARVISQYIKAHDVKIVNGPDLLSKYVGESEKNVRQLFEPAIEDQKTYGEDARLHVVIFDEFDALAKSRSSGSSDSTGVGANIVNQLLTMLDGVGQLNNILIIAMTNRIDLLDTAMLRPGRFDIQVEIPLPDEAGRMEILRIHLRPYVESGGLAPDVDIARLAALTENFSGAELASLVRRGFTNASERLFTPASEEGGAAVFDPASLDGFAITQADLLRGLAGIASTFGRDDRLQLYRTPGFVDLPLGDGTFFGEHFAQRIRRLLGTPGGATVPLLLHGDAEGVGCTTTAVHHALQSAVKFVRIIDPTSPTLQNTSEKLAAITNTLLDAYRSPVSIVIISKLELLLEYSRPEGCAPVYSNPVLVRLRSAMRAVPPNGHKVMLLCTSNDGDFLRTMKLREAFREAFCVPRVSRALLEDRSRFERLFEGYLGGVPSDQRSKVHHAVVEASERARSDSISMMYLVEMISEFRLADQE
ncbi:hypothetical protein H696_01818 [Fonticula alba]|uniref:Vesicle-fusing ATPase n=1 Tax=Fonticula alba TaxID=691883 RepID=A0A058ZBR7_FONAL|nr:hypothetical protein H696_01818 [Fonticula alba]KCV70872.1 hypothetical protein H696_01818 [Fonticula alba]|eukprot:XP_009493995.1 hypothetical protein H696_01818 [Fonticula alba]